MGNITRNFSRWEFACHDSCGLMDPHPLLVVGLQQVRDQLGDHRATVTSGSRCRAWNAHEGGAPNSQHLRHRGGYTLAADVVFHGADLQSVVDAVLAVPQFAQGGVGIYLDSTPRVHVDVRLDGPARWAYIDGEKVAFTDAYARAKGVSA